MKSSNERTLYFTAAPHDDYLVFAPPARARFVDQIHRAIEESMTWGEFRRRLPTGEYEKLYGDQFSTDPEVIAEDDGAREPADEEAFDCSCVPGYEEGDYPPWLVQEQHRYLPDDVLREFATRESTFLNGGFWRIESARAQEIVVRLQTLGYQIERRDDLKFW